MQVLKADTLSIITENDIVRVRQLVRTRAIECRFSLVDQTKVVTASSELARNTLIHGGGGKVTMEIVSNDLNALVSGLRLEFEDQGPGIEDVERALEDGYTTGGGMGLGLPGARRLANEFEICSEPGKGTRVRIVKWRAR